ncbi:MAG: hypothetical protein WC100_01475 [Sterolibacterium sp.]
MPQRNSEDRKAMLKTRRAQQRGRGAYTIIDATSFAGKYIPSGEFKNTKPSNR